MEQLNKNISVWRGDDKTPPPTDFHLWVKDSGSIWLKIKGSWQCVGSSENGNLEDLDKKIKAIIAELVSVINSDEIETAFNNTDSDNTETV